MLGVVSISRAREHFEYLELLGREPVKRRCVADCGIIENPNSGPIFLNKSLAGPERSGNRRKGSLRAMLRGFNYAPSTSGLLMCPANGALLLSLLMLPQTIQQAPHGITAMQSFTEVLPIGNVINEFEIRIVARYPDNEPAVGTDDRFDGH
jgi:hypothetical protein